MSEPVVFIIRFKIKEGKAAEFRMHYRESIQRTFETKPGTLAELAYENEEATEFTVIRQFPNADALDRHLHGADERSVKSFTFIEPIRVEIYGSLNPGTLEKMVKIAGPGTPMEIHPNYTGGFIRQVEAGERRI